MMLNILTYTYFHLYVFSSVMSIHIFVHFNSIFFLIVVFQEFLVYFRCVCVCVLVHLAQFSSVQFSLSVMSNSLWPHGLQWAQLPVHYRLPELAQTHVLQVTDDVQPSHPLSSPSPLVIPFFSLLQPSSVHGILQARVLEWVPLSR